MQHTEADIQKWWHRKVGNHRKKIIINFGDGSENEIFFRSICIVTLSQYVAPVRSLSSTPLQ